MLGMIVHSSDTMPISTSESVNAISEFEKVRNRQISWVAFDVKKCADNTSHYFDVIRSVPVVKQLDYDNYKVDNFKKNIWNGLIDWCSRDMKSKPCIVFVRVMGDLRGDRPSDKFLLMHWLPDSANIREKMLYSTSFNDARKIFNINWVIEVSDVADLNFERLYN